MSEVYVAVTVSTDEVYHLAIQMEMRCPSTPRGSGWVKDATSGVWSNPIDDAYIEYFIALNERQWAHRKDSRGGPAIDSGISVMSWRRITKEEHEKFNSDRSYRNALRDVDGLIDHNMDAARECHRNVLRLERTNNLPMLDILWMRALARNDVDACEKIEAERRKWRDAPIDPRIDVAKTVEELKKIIVEVK